MLKNNRKKKNTTHSKNDVNCTVDIVCSVAELCRMFGLGIVYLLCSKSKTFRVAAKKEKKKICVSKCFVSVQSMLLHAGIRGLPLPA